MYDCQTILKLLYPYLDGELDVKESLRVQSHLEECHDCLEIFKREKEFLQVLKSSSFINKAPTGFRERLIGLLRPSEATYSHLRSLFPFRTLLVSTMAMLLMIMVGVILYALPKQMEKPHLDLVKVAFKNHEGIREGKLLPDIMSTEPAEVIKWLEQQKLGFPVVLPQEITAMQLVGGKLIHFQDMAEISPVPSREKKAALLIFESKKGGKVSLIMASPQHLKALKAKVISFGFPGSPRSLTFYLTHYQGYYALAWTDPQLSYVLVSDEKERIAEACRICHRNTRLQDMSGFDDQI